MLSNNIIESSFIDYEKSTIFDGSDQAIINNTPFGRPLSFNKKVDYAQLISTGTTKCPEVELYLHRLLFNIYEQDLMYLPPNSSPVEIDKFHQFYDRDHYRQGQIILPFIERVVFEKLEGQHNSLIQYSTKDMHELFDQEFESCSGAENSLIITILNSNNTERALQTFLIQCAGDFLTEASGMARNLLGNYGPIQSNLFKVLIDEYGYGVHETKHSYAYEKLLIDQGLSPSPHSYWNYYFNSSLALHNYIHFICSNHANFFRYVGALYYAEATYSGFCKEVSAAIQQVSGKQAETFYFDEHFHIDIFHCRMVRDSVIAPILKQFGDKFNNEIIKGFNEFKYFLQWNAEEIIRQINFLDKVGLERTLTGSNLDEFTLGKSLKVGNVYAFTVATEDLLLVSDSDGITLSFAHNVFIAFDKEEAIFIPKGIHYGIVSKGFGLVTLYQRKR